MMDEDFNLDVEQMIMVDVVWWVIRLIFFGRNFLLLAIHLGPIFNDGESNIKIFCDYSISVNEVDNGLREMVVGGQLRQSRLHTNHLFLFILVKAFFGLI